MEAVLECNFIECINFVGQSIAWYEYWVGLDVRSKWWPVVYLERPALWLCPVVLIVFWTAVRHQPTPVAHVISFNLAQKTPGSLVQWERGLLPHHTIAPKFRGWRVGGHYVNSICSWCHIAAIYKWTLLNTSLSNSLFCTMHRPLELLKHSPLQQARESNNRQMITRMTEFWLFL